ncbi:unnamed protein product [Closterium sp. NIES-65]|nr:unnamed protein product [Closterium sp. NIES-65]
MTYQNALDLLGVREGATFDDILRAKKRITDPGTADQELLLRVEAACDILLMQSLSRRRSCEVADNCVEAAYDILLMQSLSRRRSGEVVDSSVRFADVQKPRPPAPPSWLQKALKSSAGKALGLSTGGLVLGAVVDSLVYPVGSKAAGLSQGGACAGSSGGQSGTAWLRVDIFPLPGIGSPPSSLVNSPLSTSGSPLSSCADLPQVK